MLRASRFLRAAEADNGARGVPFDHAVLEGDERHLRRRVVTLAGGERLLVDFAEAAALDHRDVLVLDDGRQIEIIAAEEDLYAVHGRDAAHLAALAWHIGNRHMPAAIEDGHLLILRDHVIRAMLERLGASVAEVRGRFSPIRGAYSAGGHSHATGEHHGHHEHS